MRIGIAIKVQTPGLSNGPNLTPKISSTLTAPDIPSVVALVTAILTTPVSITSTLTVTMPTQNVPTALLGALFVSAATNTAGTTVTITFDKDMANPSGKHASFAVNDGSANATTAAALNATTTKIDLTLTRTITAGRTVTTAYTMGTVQSADGAYLKTFTAQSTTNNGS